MKNEIKIEVENFEGTPINLCIGYTLNGKFNLLARISVEYLDSLIKELERVKKEVLNATIIH